MKRIAVFIVLLLVVLVSSAEAKKRGYMDGNPIYFEYNSEKETFQIYKPNKEYFGEMTPLKTRENYSAEDNNSFGAEITTNVLVYKLVKKDGKKNLVCSIYNQNEFDDIKNTYKTEEYDHVEFQFLGCKFDSAFLEQAFSVKNLKYVSFLACTFPQKANFRDKTSFQSLELAQFVKTRPPKEFFEELTAARNLHTLVFRRLRENQKLTTSDIVLISQIPNLSNVLFEYVFESDIELDALKGTKLKKLFIGEEFPLDLRFLDEMTSTECMLQRSTIDKEKAPKRRDMTIIPQE